MIERYARKEMEQVWSLEQQYQAWLEVEIAVDRAWAKQGIVPMEDLEKIEKNASFTVERCLELEQRSEDVV